MFKIRFLPASFWAPVQCSVVPPCKSGSLELVFVAPGSDLCPVCAFSRCARAAASHW